MNSIRLPARQMLRRAALIVSLLICSSTAVAGMSRAAMPAVAKTDPVSAPAAVVTRVLPSDRAIMLLEGRDPENAGLPVVLVQGAETDVTATTESAGVTEINHCVPCDILV